MALSGLTSLHPRRDYRGFAAAQAHSAVAVGLPALCRFLPLRTVTLALPRILPIERRTTCVCRR